MLFSGGRKGRRAGEGSRGYGRRSIPKDGFDRNRHVCSSEGRCLFDARRVLTCGMAQQLIHIRTVPAPALLYSINPPRASASHLTRASISDKTRSDQHHHNISITLEYSSTVQKSLHNTNLQSWSLANQESAYDPMNPSGPYYTT